MIMTAKRHGRCEKCGHAIKPGDEIEWSPGPWTCHATCPEGSVAESGDGVGGNAEGKGGGEARAERATVCTIIITITVGMWEGDE